MSQEEMGRGKEITSENDGAIMSDNSMPLKHTSEVLLTIQTTDNEKEILTSDSDNPPNPPCIASSSKPKSNDTPDSDSSVSHSPKIPNFTSYIIEHANDWSAISLSDRDYSGKKRTEIDSDSDIQIGKENNIERSQRRPSKKKRPSKKERSQRTNIFVRPEKVLINFALIIVIMEKTASGIGLLAFIWATVVLLGGFASALQPIDFGFVTMIIFMVGTGAFNRNHQLDSRFFFQAAKVISSTIGRYLTILQFSFASICIALSVMRLAKHYYSEEPNTANMKVALYIFYAMALVHGVLFLIKKAYWFWMVYYCKIIQAVSDNFGFEMPGELLLQRFFYETYWKLNKGSVFSALDLDVITFAQGLLISDSRKDQLLSVRILNGTINQENYFEETCRRLETSTETICKLFKMLTWKYQEDGTIRIIAANIVEKLASNLLVEDIPGGMDCIHSLLTVLKKSEVNAKTLELNLVGLNILKKLADNPKNCWKLWETHGLLSMIVEFSKYKNDCIPDSYDKFKIVKQSLMLLTKIISTDGKTGEMLRTNITNSTLISNLRDILIDEYKNQKLLSEALKKQKLLSTVVETLTALSTDKNARKKIGSTFGIIEVLLSIFFNLRCTNYKTKLRVKVGSVLAILVLQSKRNCSEIFDLKSVVEKLIEIIQEFVYRKNPKSRNHIIEYKIIAIKILRNLCAYAGRKWQQKLREVVKALPWVLKTIMSTENDYRILEASTGLCVQICKLTGIKEYRKVLTNAGYSMADVAEMVLIILKDNNAPNNKYPCKRRYAIELAIWMMESYDPFISYFREGQLGEVLTRVAETTSELENFQFYFGDVGVAKHPQTIHSLVLKAKKLLA